MSINRNELEPLIKSLEEKALINDPTRQLNQNFVPFDKDKELPHWKDLKVKVEVVLGTTRLNIDKISSLKKESIIIFEDLADEFVDIYVNDKKVAKGKIATVDNHYAIQIVHILDKKERILLNS